MEPSQARIVPGRQKQALRNQLKDGRSLTAMVGEPVFLDYTLRNAGTQPMTIVSADPNSFCSAYFSVVRRGAPACQSFIALLAAEIAFPPVRELSPSPCPSAAAPYPCFNAMNATTEPLNSRQEQLFNCTLGATRAL
jgi:hypothetical protein